MYLVYFTPSGDLVVKEQSLEWELVVPQGRGEEWWREDGSEGNSAGWLLEFHTLATTKVI